MNLDMRSLLPGDLFVRADDEESRYYIMLDVPKLWEGTPGRWRYFIRYLHGTHPHQLKTLDTTVWLMGRVGD